MKLYTTACLLFISMPFLSYTATAQTDTLDHINMTQEKLVRIIWEEANHPEGSDNAVQFVYEEIVMALFSDTHYDRMRIIAPIIKKEDMTGNQLNAVLDANFHTALDARYATSDDVLYAVFIHPLSPLSREQVVSALRQVAALVQNFGDSYSSDEILYTRPEN